MSNTNTCISLACREEQRSCVLLLSRFRAAGLRRGSPVASRDRKQQCVAPCLPCIPAESYGLLLFAAFFPPFLLLPLCSLLTTARLGTRRTFLQCPPAGSQDGPAAFSLASCLIFSLWGKTERVA